MLLFNSKSTRMVATISMIPSLFLLRSTCFLLFLSSAILLPQLTQAFPPLEQKPSSNRNLLITAATPSSTIEQFLSPQNALRAELGLPPLEWSESVADFARLWASQRQGDCKLIHSGSRRFGENIFYGWGKVWTPEDAVAWWASEVQFYSYKINVCAYGQDCLHYTQMVWKQTTKVGCAQVACSSGGTTFITCNYDPPGNIIGEKPY